MRVLLGEKSDARRGRSAVEPKLHHAAAPTSATRANEDAAHMEAAMGAGQFARAAVARSGAARAYGVSAPREVDYIDVSFEEVHEPAFVRCLVRGSSMRALPRGERDD